MYLKYHMTILLGHSNANIGTEDIFKLIIGNENLHESSNVNTYIVVKSTTFLQFQYL
jgi:hypothetical protein